VYYSYNATNHTLTISGQGEMYVLCSIGEDDRPWRSFLNDIQTVIIESGVTNISTEMFGGCSNLTSVIIPNSVTTIGGGAFANCSSLCSVIIPNSVTNIEVYHDVGAFDNTAWYNNQPNGLVYAGKVAYKYKGTMPANTHITLQEGTLGIASETFSGCSGLTSITIPNSVSTIGSYAFYSCSGLTSITIPNNSVTSIGSYAFYGCSGLTSVTIPNSVTSISSNVFIGCIGLTSIKVDNGNSKYDSRNNCNAIIDSNNQLILGCKNTIIPNSVNSIGENAFYGCSDLTSVTIPTSVSTIGSYAFYGCSGLTSVTIPNNSVTSIGSYAFYGCSGLTSVAIPNSVTSIGSNAFFGCIGLTSIKVDNGNSKYDSRNNCNAIIDNNNWLVLGCKNTIIPNSVSTIVSYAFSGCSGLTSITIPNSVTYIGAYAFRGCTGLVYIILPSNLSSLENSCFSGCNNITYIYCNAKEVPFLEYGVFDNPGNITLYVPSESYAAYNNDSRWGMFNVQANSSLQSTEKCLKPTINLSDGKYVFNCETPNVQYRWIISTSDGNNGYSYSSSYSFSQITLNVFATKDGYQPSDVATYVLSGLSGDVNNDGKVNVADHVKLSDIIMNQNE